MATDFNASIVRFFINFPNPFFQLCSCAILGFVTKYLEMSSFVELAIQLFAQSVLQVEFSLVKVKETISALNCE